MPSVLHEALVDLFRRKPTLAAELLTSALGATLPAHTETRVESADLSQTVATSYHADLVLLLLDGVAVLAIIVEVQLGRDADKRGSWPVYVTALRARERCPVWLFVVTPDEAVARWAAEPIVIGPPGFVLTPAVLGPGNIPFLDPRADADPYLAVLSAMAHATGDPTRAAQAALTAFAAASRLDDASARLYYDLVEQRLSPAAKAALEDLMISGHYEYQSEFARKYVALGEAEGEARGQAKGKAETIVAVLEARGVVVPSPARERILACRDVAVLDRWVVQAISASSADELA